MIVVASAFLFSAGSAFAATGAISGTVTAASSSAPLQNIEVDVFDSSHNFVGEACTAASGTYTVGGLSPASYVVQFVANNTGAFGGCTLSVQNLASQYYNNKATFATADPVSVTGGSTTSGINAAMATGGQIKGTVTAASGGANLQNIAVIAFDSNGNFAGLTCTAANGTYTLPGLSTDTTGYVVQFQADSGSGGLCGPPQNYITQYYNGQSSYASANRVPVTAGSTVTGINAAMQTGGQIIGTVTAAAGGAPLPNIEVDVLDPSGNFVGEACTASNGTYAVQGLSTASYVVQFLANGAGFFGGCAPPQNYASQYYNNRSTLATADPVSVTGGSTTSGIDAAMATGGQITGKVTDGSTGAALANVATILYDASGNIITTTCTATGGTYGFVGLGSGAYRVGFNQFSFCGGPSGYGTQFYRYEPTLTSADPVNVTVGATTSGIDGALAPAGTHVLAVSQAGSGSGSVSSSPAGISCPGTCANAFTSGSSVTLTASPASGSTFSGWSGAGCSGSGTCTVTMGSDASVTATFTTTPPPPPPPHTLAVSRAGSGSGSVSSSPAGISCPGTCANTFTSGSSVTLTASPAFGSTFSGWSGGGCSGTGTCTVTMSVDQSVTASFATIPPPPPPTCRARVAANTVLMTLPKRHTASVKARLGRLFVIVTGCTENAGLKLTAKLTEMVMKPKRHTKVFSLGAAHGSAVPGKTTVLSVRLPVGALKALQHGAQEGVKFVLTVRNANGSSKITLSIAMLRGVSG